VTQKIDSKRLKEAQHFFPMI